MQPKKWKRISHNLVLNRESGVYYVRKNRKGRVALFESTRLSQRMPAQAEADRKMVAWLGSAAFEGKRRRVGDLWDELDLVLEKEFETFAADGNRLRRKRTRDKDRTYGPIIKSLFGETYADEWDEQRWHGWVQSDGRKLGRKLGDIAKYLSKVLTYAYQRKAIARKPEIKNPDGPPAAVKTYGLDEVRDFHKHADPTLRDLIVIGIDCGLRPHETCGLEWSWIDIKRTEVRVNLPHTFTKTRKGRSIVLSQGAADIIRRRSRAKVGPYLFPSPKASSRPLSDVQRSRLWRRMLVRAGAAKGLQFRFLRHTFFSQALLESKQPLAMVAAYGGNSPKILFDRYMAKDAERTRDVSNAVNLRVTKL